MRKAFLVLAIWLLPLVAQAQQVLTEGNRPSYCVGSVNLALSAGSIDAFTLGGSATKTIRVVYADIGGTATAATAVQMGWIKRTSAYSGGTSSSLAANISKMDSAADPAATATATTYTAGPTVGTFSGYYRSHTLSLSTSAGPASIIVDRFGVDSNRAAVLRGVNEFFSLFINSVTGTVLNFSVCWVEE